jgi:hypothetical protein
MAAKAEGRMQNAETQDKAIPSHMAAKAEGTMQNAETQDKAIPSHTAAKAEGRMQNAETQDKAIPSHTQATLRLTGSQPVGTPRLPRGYPEAYPALRVRAPPSEGNESALSVGLLAVCCDRC